MDKYLILYDCVHLESNVWIKINISENRETTYSEIIKALHVTIKELELKSDCVVKENLREFQE